ncbi:MAG: hypothetical protein ABSD67_04005 [Terracidiphilus sp.]|jgi:hypothetical protein
MEHFVSLVLSHPYLAVYAFICTEAISALMIANKSRMLPFLALYVAVIGAILIPAGTFSYY